MERQGMVRNGAPAGGPAPGALLDALLRGASEGIVVHARDGSIVLANDAAERILGLTADQLAGRTSIDPRWAAIREDGRPWPGEEHPAMRTLRTGEPVRGEIMGVRLPDGATRWISITSLPVDPDRPGAPVSSSPTASSPTAGGGPAGPAAVVALFTEVTELRTERERLEASEERYRRLAEHASDVIWTVAIPSLRVTYVSPSVERLRGVDPIEVLGEPAEDWWTPGSAPDLLAMLRDLAGRGGPATATGLHEAVAADGTVHHVETTASALRDAAGRATEILCASRDVSERVRLEAARLRTAAELHAAEAHVRTLTGLLPVCMDCRRIRSDGDRWDRLEEYVAARTTAVVSHGLCPDCLALRMVEAAADDAPPGRPATDPFDLLLSPGPT